MNALIRMINNMNRLPKQFFLMFVDSILAVFLLILSFPIRLGYWVLPNSELLFMILISPLLLIPIFFSFGLYSSIIRFIGAKGFWSIIQATSLYAIAWGLLTFMASIEGIPRSIILINWMLCLIFFGGSRALARWLFLDTTQFSANKKNNLIIYGAGSAGVQLSRSLQLSEQYNLVAYIDDNPSLAATSINSTKVYNPKDIKFLSEKYNVKDVFIALPSISRKQKNRIIANLTPLSLHVRSLPSIQELAEGTIKFDDLREININELLGRDSVKPNLKLLKTNVSNKNVLITGAGGSIGSELSRQIVLLKPKKIILYELSEVSLYQIDQELTNLNIESVEIFPILGSVSSEKFKEICIYFHVQTIYHAAAYKHVPLVEYNQSEGVLNNSIGTMNAARVAIEANVETFVLISTDKAVRPTNTMGATKRIAELILQALSREIHNTCFSIVRFGNVLDSSGSVIPLFKKQIRSGGPITVTDKRIVRYFMTIPEAVELVIQAGAMGKGGDIFLLDMGSPVKIYDLAVKMIQLSGLQVLNGDNPDGDIEIQFTGLRPGEKLYEELLIGGKVTETKNKLIMNAIEDYIEWTTLEVSLEKLLQACLSHDQKLIREIIVSLLPDFKPQSPVVDYLYKD
jgi:FlaA1/EpsC-like NDP-sugar epimerase